MNDLNINEYFKEIKVIGFDADDTLWINETYFRDAEDYFCTLMTEYETENQVRQQLLKTEIKNLELYGYGIKGFILSMIECALEISNNSLHPNLYNKILDIGKDMLTKPVELIPGVSETLEVLSKNYRLLLLTKGDLLDQEKKVERSGLGKFFHHVEVLSDKKSKNYKDLLEHLSIPFEDFAMVGNSLKSDVLPLIELNSKAVHIPFHTTWEHEKVNSVQESNFLKLENITKLQVLMNK